MWQKILWRGGGGIWGLTTSRQAIKFEVIIIFHWPFIILSFYKFFVTKFLTKDIFCHNCNNNVFLEESWFNPGNDHGLIKFFVVESFFILCFFISGLLSCITWRQDEFWFFLSQKFVTKKKIVLGLPLFFCFLIHIFLKRGRSFYKVHKRTFI